MLVRTSSNNPTSQPAFTRSKLTIETLEQGVKYVFFFQVFSVFTEYRKITNMYKITKVREAQVL